jgi:xylulose-5-phosphate/fructose-6-phosphate phosphoketolase
MMLGAMQEMRDEHIEHTHYVAEHGIDMPEVLEWRWS